MCRTPGVSSSFTTCARTATNMARLMPGTVTTIARSGGLRHRAANDFALSRSAGALGVGVSAARM